VPLPLLAQPVTPSVTITVKFVLAAGEFVIDAVVSPSLHRKLGSLALVVAVSTVDITPQFVTEFTLTVGIGLTMMVPLPLLAQPVTPSVTVTV
jgi:hypothetical protein